MQLKLLNFYKFLSNFANDLVGAFVPLIIYSVTGKLFVALLYLCVKEAIRLGFALMLRNKMQKNPQIFLLLRIITLTLYNVFIIVLDYNVWVGVCGICIFFALDQCFKYQSAELIYNFSSIDKGGKSLGITRLFEKLGVIASMLIGGFLLDIDRVLVVIISLSLYAISLIPLIIYYVKSRRSKTFNKDAISNAMESFNHDTKHSAYNKKIIRRIILGYAFVYFIFCTLDVFPTFYQLELFLQGSNKFALAGIFNALFNAGFGLGSVIVGKQNDKIDLTRHVQVSCFIIAISMLLFTFVKADAIVFMLFAIDGFVYSYLSVFILQRFLVKSRILGVSNWAILFREWASVACYVVMFGISVIFSVLPEVLIYPMYLITAATFIYCIYLIPKNEEKTRKLLVDFLEDNEIKSDKEEIEEKSNEVKA